MTHVQRSCPICIIIDHFAAFWFKVQSRTERPCPNRIGTSHFIFIAHGLKPRSPTHAQERPCPVDINTCGVSLAFRFKARSRASRAMRQKDQFVRSCWCPTSVWKARVLKSGGCRRQSRNPVRRPLGALLVREFLLATADDQEDLDSTNHFFIAWRLTGFLEPGARLTDV